MGSPVTRSLSALAVSARRARDRVPRGTGAVPLDLGPGRGTFPDRCGNPLDRARTNVAEGEDAGHRRLEGKPELFRFLRPWTVVTGQDVSLAVTRDLLREPVRARHGADHDEQAADVQRARVSGGPVAQGQGAQLLIVARLGNLAVQMNADVGQ